MAPLELQGNTLGEKHKHYNEIVNNITQQDSMQHLSSINYEDNDLDNILKIDIACAKRDVQYILEVFKCRDILYVSRAVKQSVWLVTDEQYAHVIHPKYLHSQLFPHMSSKAVNKLSLFIRLKLKEEARVEEFFTYYENINIEMALKWLPNCSISFIENATLTYANIMNVKILKRLCEKSIKVLQVFVDQRKEFLSCIEMEATTFLLKKHLKEYLDLVESLDEFHYPKLNANCTRVILKTDPDRILNNFEKYAHKIHLQTFVKFMRSENIAPFLSQYRKNSKLRYWFCEENLKPFILAMPVEIKVEFLKNNFIDQHEGFDEMREKNYDWYKYIPFEIAFKDIKKLIQKESSVNERNLLLKVLLFSAGRNLQHIHVILQYFRNHHFNEPILFKKKFVIALLEQINAFKLNDTTWKILEEFFMTMKVYSESENNVQSFVKVAITRKVINNETVPEILEKKFSFETLKTYILELNKVDTDLIFNYLYNHCINKINGLNISNKYEFKEGINLIKNVLTLLSDWGKNLTDFPAVLTKINKLIEIKKANTWDIDVTCIYKIKKSWKKYLFQNSIDLCPSQEVYLNALKHDPNLLSSKHMFESLYCNDTGPLKQYLNKIRLYWGTSLAKDSISFCFDEINRRNDNESLIRHICYLLPLKLLHDMATKYAPKEEKIDWYKNETVLLNTQKNIAKHIYTARPQPSLEVILWYAKGDYLQFAVPSLMAVLHNMSCIATRKYIKVLIKAPVSLRKYGIRVAIDKLNNEEIIEIFSEAWNGTKNKSIRADLFKYCFKLLCKEKNEIEVQDIWSLMEIFIETLTDEENEVIYKTLTQVNQVPCCVRVAFWKKSVLFFKKFPSKSIDKRFIETVVYSSKQFMEIVDVDFIAEILKENFKLNMATDSYNDIDLISCCLLSSKNVESQAERYDKILYPIMEMCILSWKSEHGDVTLLRRKLYQLLTDLCKNFHSQVLAKRNVIPDSIFNEIQKYLELKLPDEENYLLLKTWKFACVYVRIIAHNISEKPYFEMENSGKTSRADVIDERISEISKQFGEELVQILKQDLKLYYPSIYVSFSDALDAMFDLFWFNKSYRLNILLSMLNHDLKESFLVVLKLMPLNLSEEDTPIKNVIMEIIRSHPSPEIKMFYNNHCSKLLFN
ncbi:uncharacterized protein [Battus philenor]|uniref:uncharacterized protein isoform X2 n=1 Tax=Battus philenor TaxID=42288 RepID=UPI0035D02560